MNLSSHMHAHLLQLDIAWEDKGTNHDKVRALIDRAAPNPGDLIVLPELFDVGFTLNIEAAKDDDARTLTFLQSLADETQCVIHGSRATLETGASHAHNNATACAPTRGEPLCEYAKIHPFSFGRESESFVGGTDLRHYQWNDLRVCTAICYDLRFPELFRLGVKDGAHVFALGANWPSHRQFHWRTLCIARAIENQSFFLAVNRCGNDPHLPYAGGTIAIDPKGEVLGELGEQEDVLSIAIDPSIVHDWRSTFPALNDITLI